MSANNMAIWNLVCKTDVNHTKAVSYGKRKFTAIDAMYQIETATAMFGPFGFDWGVRDETFNVIDEIILYQAELYYPNKGKEGIIPLHSSIMFDKDDSVKKVATDALTKGLSKIGFNADVFLGEFDGNKYTVNGIASEFKPKGTVMITPKQVVLINKLINSHVITEDERAKVAKWLDKNPNVQEASDQIDKLQVIIKERKEAEKVEA